MRKTVFFVFCICALASNALVAEESLTITTYYPSPYGVYNELSTNTLVLPEQGTGAPNASDCNTLAEKGRIRVYSSQLYYCDGSTWSAIGGGGAGTLWAKNPDDAQEIYNTNAKGVAIGRQNPEDDSKLDIDGKIRIRGGSPNVGKVLVSTTNGGLGEWRSPSMSSYTTGRHDGLTPQTVVNMGKHAFCMLTKVVTAGDDLHYHDTSCSVTKPGDSWILKGTAYNRHCQYECEAMCVDF
jgi:hypothetical protein